MRSCTTSVVESARLPRLRKISQSKIDSLIAQRAEKYRRTSAFALSSDIFYSDCVICNLISSAAARVAAYAKAAAGSKFWARAWCIRACWRVAALIPKNIRVLPLVSVLTV